ncbi:siderophore-interacting protein, partial [Rothia kristinae]
MTRTYTVRAVDHEAQTRTIDFVTHGDEGLAAPWAAQASPGDQLVLMRPGGKYSPDPDADWHLFAGDASALPALGSAIEVLPDDARGYAFITPDHDEDRQEVASGPEGFAGGWKGPEGTC